MSNVATRAPNSKRSPKSGPQSETRETQRSIPLERPEAHPSAPRNVSAAAAWVTALTFDAELDGAEWGKGKFAALGDLAGRLVAPAPEGWEAASVSELADDLLLTAKAAMHAGPDGTVLSSHLRALSRRCQVIAELLRRARVARTDAAEIEAEEGGAR